MNRPRHKAAYIPPTLHRSQSGWLPIDLVFTALEVAVFPRIQFTALGHTKNPPKRLDAIDAPVA